MPNPLEPLVTGYQKMVKDQDEKGTAEKFKQASDIFFDRLRRKDTYARRNEPVKFTPIDTEYGDGYFIFGTGTNSVVHFHLEETPGWLYGLWLSEIDQNDPNAQKPVKIRFFAQFEDEIDKFKPSASIVSEECIVSMGVINSIECTHIKTAIHFIQQHPALAWYRDIHWVNYNDEYVPESAAKRRYELYLKARSEGLGDCVCCGGLSTEDGCKGCLYDRATKAYDGR